MSKWWLFYLFFFSLFLLPRFSFAAVYINEFMANPPTGESEWVEFYNPDQVEIIGYWLDDDLSFEDDSGSSKKIEIKSLENSETLYPYLEMTSFFLNNEGDYVVLFDQNGDKVDDYSYNSDPGKGFSIGRAPDGEENWVVFDKPSKGEPNPSPPTATPTPASTITPSSVSTPTPTPEEPRASYKINEVRDENGETLSNVKIYLDGIYLHHYAPETLTFCYSCQCDGDTDCGFGDHTIRLEKPGYQDWQEEISINAGDSKEVSPRMVPLDQLEPTPSSTPTPTTGPISSPRPTPSPTEVITSSPPRLTTEPATLSGEILGSFGETTESGRGMEEKGQGGSQRMIAGGLVVLGAGLISSVAFAPQIKDFLAKIKKGGFEEGQSSDEEV